RGTMRVGVWRGAPGLNFEHPQTGDVVGIEVELLARLEKELGVRIEQVGANWVDLPKKLRRREFDLIFCGIIPDPAYPRLLYSHPYLDQGLVIMRRTGNTEITNLRSLDGKTVAIIADPAARAVIERSGIRPRELREVYDNDYFAPTVDGVYDAFVI